MKKVILILIYSGLFAGGFCEAPNKPNILLIFADDLAPILGLGLFLGLLTGASALPRAIVSSSGSELSQTFRPHSMAEK